VLECVPNVSEGRDRAALSLLAEACGRSLLDLHADPDHDRAVLTLAGPDDAALDAAVRTLARVVATRIDGTSGAGVHPRTGLLDVVPFVALDGTDRVAAVEHARAFGEWVVRELGLPVFWYGDVHPEARALPETRRAITSGTAPDLGKVAPSPALGVVAVGARPVLVAVNCDLDRDDVELARAVAAEVRARDGGLAGVRALGFRLASKGRSQVSMNLVDLARTGVERASDEVVERVRLRGAAVDRIEIVGLVPAAELARWSARFRDRAGLGDDGTIEARLASRRAG
jgi:glutamate formiminotransferase